MKKIIIIIFILLLIGCTDQSVVQEKEIINFRITWKPYSGRGEAIYKIVEKFNETQEEYEVVLTGDDEDLNEIRESIINQEAQVYVLPYRYVQLLGSEQMIQPITLDIEEKTISKSLLNLGKVNSDLYGLPWVSHSMALLYNKNILEQAGVNPENIRNSTTFIEALKEIQNKTSSYGLGLVGANHNDLSWMVNQFIYGNGGSLMEEGKLSIHSDKTREAIEYYKELSQYAQPTWLDDTGLEVMDYFRQGELAFEIQSIWGITDIWKNGHPFEVGVIPLIRIGAYSEVGPMMLSIPNIEDEKLMTCVYDFLDFMTEEEAQEMIMLGEYSPEHDRYFPFRLPVREDMLKSDSFDSYEIFKPFIESYAFSSIDVPDPKWQLIKDEVYTPSLRNVFLNQMTIDELFQKLENAVEVYGGNNEN